MGLGEGEGQGEGQGTGLGAGEGNEWHRGLFGCFSNPKNCEQINYNEFKFNNDYCLYFLYLCSQVFVAPFVEFVCSVKMQTVLVKVDCCTFYLLVAHLAYLYYF